MSDPSSDSSRRDFLAGRSLKNEVESAAARVGDALVEGAAEANSDNSPASGSTVRLGTRAMACDFHVILNAGEDSTVETWHASDALNLVHRLEDQMTVYRETSDLLELNQQAAEGPAEVEERLFELLLEARRISELTGGAFDPTSQPVVSLWRRCREEARVPEEVELAEVLSRVGMGGVEFGAENSGADAEKAGGEPPHPDPLPLKGERGLLRARDECAQQEDGTAQETVTPLLPRGGEGGRRPDEGADSGIQLTRQFAGQLPARTVRFSKPEIELNLNGIGKGYALDRAAELLAGAESGYEISNWLLHGGHSSVLARGVHFGPDGEPSGWPVGVRHPLFPDQRLATIVLRDQAMGTSGSGVQFFRVGGKRYGHVLDPRTGWPVDHLLSVTVITDSAGWKYPAAAADALGTAFFVMGLEKAVEFCQNRSDVRALLIPPPRRGRTLEPVVCGIPDEDLFFAPDTSAS